MFLDNLYERILINPIKKGANKLYILSGFASATFAKKHLEDCLVQDPKIKINLLIGMKRKGAADHDAFLNLIKKHPNNFSGYYFHGKPEIHSKVYAWFKDETPLIGFSGSANYSQYGFFEKMQGNQMNEDSSGEIYDYFNLKLKDTINIETYKLPKEEQVLIDNYTGSLLPGKIKWIESDISVRISLLRRNGELPTRSGLNWGQRPEHNRDANQAYLSIRLDARKKGFLPEKGYTFTLLTDDKKTLDCTVQQDGRKAISTTNDNSELGIYFRNRLGVPSKKMVYKKDLENYGRTDFLLKKINDETFFLDFSRMKGG